MSRFSQGHALLVGVGGDLPGTVHDARGLARLLTDEERCAYPPAQVTTLTAEDATRPRILAALDDLSTRAGAEDTVIVYFSGHGYRVNTPFGPMHFLMPHGYDVANLPESAIQGNEFRQKLAQIQARKLLVLLDCCHAGGMDATKLPGFTFAKAPLPAEAVDQLAAGQGRAVIASSKADELSYAGKPYSAFTLALMEALCGKGVAQPDGFVRMTDLALHAHQMVPQRTRDRQHPILNFDNADNFAVAYYAGGDEQPKALPFAEESVEIEPEPGVFNQRGQTVWGPQTNIKGDVYGNVYSGTIGRIGDDYHIVPDPLIERAKQTETVYLHMLRRDCNRLPLAEDDRSQPGQNQHRAQLSNVYVDLQTTSRPALTHIFDRLNVPSADRTQLVAKIKNWMAQRTSEGQRAALDEVAVHAAEFLGENLTGDDNKKHPLIRYAGNAERLMHSMLPLTTVETLRYYPHLVLLGDPGGGKSTFVNHLAYLFAGIHLGQKETLPAPLTTAFFPLRVILRRWSSALSADSKPGLELAYAALCEATGMAKEVILRRLAQPNTLVLFDGLDEAPPENADTGLDRRAVLVKSVQDFCTAHPNCRVLVTSRIKPYENKTYQLDDLPVVTLAKLDTDRIERFLRNWYAERARVEPDKAAKATTDRDRLLRSLSERPALSEMAETPLLLTMLAAVNAWAGLPESRAELYDKCVEQLLWEWEKRKQDEDGDSGGDGLLDLLHEAGLQRSDLERVLWEMTYTAHATSGADTADLPAGALREKLASIHPKKQGPNWAWAERVVALMAERGGLLVETDTGIFSFPHRSFQEYLAARWLLEQDERTAEAAALTESDTWREVVLLACGALTYSGRFSDVQAIINELTGGRRFDTPEKRLRLLVGGQAWAEFGPHRARGTTGEELTERVPERLTQLMQDRHAPPRQRLDAALLLADLHILPPDLDDFVPIAAADTLGYDFRIAKYPVTNIQFRRFVEDDGYAEDKPWWTEEAVKDIESLSPNERWRKGPRYWGDPRFDRDTQPVVGVTWYEAVAYCEWLTAQLRAQGEIGQNEEIRLPTEKEWMRAARSTHGGEYAWNSDFDPALANTEESSLGQTTPVHMYRDGKSPEDVWDLAGNVWEWLQVPRARRKGGSWYQGADRAVASSRGVSGPRNWFDSLGFRCVVVPITHG